MSTVPTVASNPIPIKYDAGLSIKPTEVYLQPFQDVANTFRATSIVQMYDYKMSSINTNIVFDVGTQTNSHAIVFTFRNKTYATKLQFVVDVPPTLSLDVPSVFVINPAEIVTMTVTTNQSGLVQQSITAVHELVANLSWTVNPVNFIGPVNVVQNLPSL